MSAFSDYSSAGTLEALALPPGAPAFSPLLAVTRRLGAVLPPGGGAAGGAANGSRSRLGGGAGAASAPSPAAQLTLPDGRLHVGTHLPLMAGRYKYLSTLGEGVSAQVILAEDTLAGDPGARLVAVKAMRRQHALAGQKEARALRYLHASAPGGAAPGVPRLLDVFSLGGHYCLVTERLYPWLLDWVADSCHLPPAQALHQLRKIAHQLLACVAFLHNCGLVHADVKPDNILLEQPPGSRSVALRLADYGGTFSLTETDTAAVGCEVQSLPYRAPEAALGQPYGAAIDLWSCGVVLAELALRRALLPCASPRDLLRQMVALLGPLPEHLVRGSALAQHLDLSALTQPAGGAAAAPPASHALPPELEQRSAAAAAAATAAAGAREGAAGLRLAGAGSALHAELAAVDASLADLLLRLLSYDPAQRLTAHQALLHPFFDPLLPLRALFPQLEEMSRLQQAALQSEAARAAAAAGGGAHSSPEDTKQHFTPSPAPARALPAALAAAAEAEAAAAEHAAGAALCFRQQTASPPDDQQQQQQGRQASQASRAQPWAALSAALAKPRPATSRLPAAQLAAEVAEQRRRLAAADPYAGSFAPAFDPTPGKEQPPAQQQQQQQVRRVGSASPALPPLPAEEPLQQGQQQQEPKRPAPRSAAKPPRSRPPPKAEGCAATAAKPRTGRSVGPPAAAAAEPKASAAAAAPAGRTGGSSKKQRQQQRVLAAALQAEEAGESESPTEGLELLLAAAATEGGAAQPKPRRTPASKAKQQKEAAGSGGGARAGQKTAAAAAAARPKQAKQQPAKQPGDEVGSSAVALKPSPAPARAGTAKKPAAAPAAPAAAPAAGAKSGSAKKARAAQTPAKPAPQQQAQQQQAQQQAAGGSKTLAALKRAHEAMPALEPASPTGAAAAGAAVSGDGPTTAAKRQRRERDADAKPWWCA